VSKGDRQTRHPLVMKRGCTVQDNDPRKHPRKYRPSLSPPVYRFRACPRCSGDLLNTDDHYGPETFCIQCGYRRENMPAARREIVRRMGLHRPDEKRSVSRAEVPVT